MWTAGQLRNPPKPPSSPCHAHSRWTGRRRHLLTAVALTGLGALCLYYWTWAQWRAFRFVADTLDTLDVHDASLPPLAPAAELVSDHHRPLLLGSNLSSIASPLAPASKPPPPALAPSTSTSTFPAAAAPLAPCARTMLYKMSGLHGFASEFGRLLRLALIAAHYRYALIVDDSEWNYGRLSDYFEPLPLHCTLSKSAFTQRRVPAGKESRLTVEQAVSGKPRWINSKHVLVRRDIDYLDALFTRLFINSTALEELHKYELSTPIPSPPLSGRLTLPDIFLPIFKVEAEMMGQLWRPNQILTAMVEELKQTLELDDGHDTKLVIAAHIRLGDKSGEISNYGPAKWAPPGWHPVGGHTLSKSKSMWGTEKLAGYFEAAESLRSELIAESSNTMTNTRTKTFSTTTQPYLLVMSDDAFAAKAMMEAPQAKNWTVISVKQITSHAADVDAGTSSSTPTAMINNNNNNNNKFDLKHGFSEAKFNHLPLTQRIKEARYFLRDLTVLGKFSDGLIFTGSSNVSKIFVLLGGSKWVDDTVIKGQPKMRSMDVRWFPTGRYI